MIIDIVVLVLCVVGAFVVDAVWRARRAPISKRPVVRRGPVPGYSRAEPSAFRRADIDRIVPELRDIWTAARVETFNSGQRRRLVVGVTTRAALPEGGLERLARALQFASGAEAAAVEILEHERADGAWAVASPDGRGWTGEERDTVLTVSRDGRAVETRAAVPGLGQVPATGWFVPPLERDVAV
jgi:hypothetical protein